MSGPEFGNLMALGAVAEEQTNRSIGLPNKERPKGKGNKIMAKERSTLLKKRRLKAEARKRWTAEANKHLLGRKIIGVRYMSDSEQ